MAVARPWHTRPCLSISVAREIYCPAGHRTIGAVMLITTENGLQWNEQEIAAIRYPDGVEIAGRDAWIRLVETLEASAFANAFENAWTQFLGEIEREIAQQSPKPD